MSKLGQLRVVVMAVLLVVVSACASDDGAAKAMTEGTPIGTAAAAGEGQGEPSDGESDTVEEGAVESTESESVGSESAGSATFDTVFGVPTEGQAVLTREFQRDEDELGFSEKVEFELTGTDVGLVVDFYTGVLTSQGYEVSEVDLGGGTAFAVSGELPDDSEVRTIAQIQIAPRQAGGETLVVSQDLSTFAQ